MTTVLKEILPNGQTIITWIDDGGTAAPEKSLTTLLVYSLVLHLVLLATWFWCQDRHPGRHAEMVVELRGIEAPAAALSRPVAPVGVPLPTRVLRGSLPVSVLQRSLEALTAQQLRPPRGEAVTSPTVPSGSAPEVPFSGGQQKVVWWHRGAPRYAPYSTNARGEYNRQFWVQPSWQIR